MVVVKCNDSASLMTSVSSVGCVAEVVTYVRSEGSVTG